MDEVATATFTSGHGIDGNADAGPRRRQVGILSAERWARVVDEVGVPVDPVLRRTNVLVSGIDLVGSRLEVLLLGRVRIEIGGELRPCRIMEEQHVGLQAALDADWGGGAWGRVLTSGTVRVGDAVAWDAP